MSRATVIMLISILIFGLNGCAAPNKTNLQWNDGTYEGKGDRWLFGDENATIVISGGKIVDVTLRKFSPEEQEVNYDEWAGQEVQGKIRPNLKQYRQYLSQEIINKQSADVNDISGATVSSKNWRLAVKRALEQAKIK